MPRKKNKEVDINTKHEFNADVSKFLRLVIHSIFTNKDIFLRELITNAIDACEKARYLLVSGESKNQDKEELQEKIKYQ